MSKKDTLNPAALKKDLEFMFNLFNEITIKDSVTLYKRKDRRIVHSVCQNLFAFRTLLFTERNNRSKRNLKGKTYNS